MGKISKRILKWRKGKGPGEIMKPSTFQEIKESGESRGLSEERATKAAGAAYWETVKKKFKESKKK